MILDFRFYLDIELAKEGRKRRPILEYVDNGCKVLVPSWCVNTVQCRHNLYISHEINVN